MQHWFVDCDELNGAFRRCLSTSGIVQNKCLQFELPLRKCAKRHPDSTLCAAEFIRMRECSRVGSEQIHLTSDNRLTPVSSQIYRYLGDFNVPLMRELRSNRSIKKKLQEFKKKLNLEGLRHPTGYIWGKRYFYNVGQ